MASKRGKVFRRQDNENGTDDGQLGEKEQSPETATEFKGKDTGEIETVNASDFGTETGGTESGGSSGDENGAGESGTETGGQSPDFGARPKRRGTGTKRTGTAKRTRSASSGEKESESPLKLAQAIFGIHYSAAQIFNLKSVAISEPNAIDLANAVTALDDTIISKIDPRVIAIGNLVLTSAMIYIPMFINVKKELKERKGAQPLNFKPEQPQAQPESVVNLGGDLNASATDESTTY